MGPRNLMLLIQPVSVKHIFRFWCLCIVTFGQKVPKLNSRPVYCLQLYGNLFLWTWFWKYWNNVFCFSVGAGVLQVFTPNTLPAHRLGMNSLTTRAPTVEACTAIGLTGGIDEACKAAFKVSAYQGFFMELIVTMVFVLLILNVTEERNGPQW